MTTYSVTAYSWYEDGSQGIIDDVTALQVGFVGTSNLELSYSYTNAVVGYDLVQMSILDGYFYDVSIYGEPYSLSDANIAFQEITMVNGDSLELALLCFGDLDGAGSVLIIPLGGDYAAYFNDGFDLSALEYFLSNAYSDDELQIGDFAEGEVFSLSELPGVQVSEHDSMFDIQNTDYMLGEAGNDQLVGWEGDDYLHGGAGADILFGSFGEDTIIGGKGLDIASYNFTDGEQGVVVNLAKGFAIDGWGYRDEVSQVEGLVGSLFDDKLIGNKKDNTFYGLAGDDTIKGGAGYDLVDYTGDEGNGGYDGVTVNLAKGFAIDGFGDRDELTSIEDVFGTIYNDKLVGDGGHNFLAGLEGRDTLIGGKGDDTLSGGEGNDILKGKGGADVFIFDDVSGRDKIFGFKAGVDLIDLVQADVSFDDLSFSKSGKFVLVEYGDVEILVRGASLSEVNSEDTFLF